MGEAWWDVWDPGPGDPPCWAEMRHGWWFCIACGKYLDKRHARTGAHLKRSARVEAFYDQARPFTAHTPPPSATVHGAHTPPPSATVHGAHTPSPEIERAPGHHDSRSEGDLHQEVASTRAEGGPHQDSVVEASQLPPADIVKDLATSITVTSEDLAKFHAFMFGNAAAEPATGATSAAGSGVAPASGEPDPLLDMILTAPPKQLQRIAEDMEIELPDGTDADSLRDFLVNACLAEGSAAPAAGMASSSGLNGRASEHQQAFTLSMSAAPPQQAACAAQPPPPPPVEQAACAAKPPPPRPPTPPSHTSEQAAAQPPPSQLPPPHTLEQAACAAQPPPPPPPVEQAACAAQPPLPPPPGSAPNPAPISAHQQAFTLLSMSAAPSGPACSAGSPIADRVRLRLEGGQVSVEFWSQGQRALVVHMPAEDARGLAHGLAELLRVNSGRVLPLLG